MKNQLLLLFMTVSLLAGFSACGDKDDDHDHNTPCDKTWTVLKGPAASDVHVHNGYLHLEADSCPTGAAVSVYREVDGDFTATANFTGFLPGTGGGGFAQFVMSNPLVPDSGIVVCGIGSGAISAKVGNHAAVIKSVSGNSGVMSIQRNGNSVTATTTVNGETVSSTRIYLTGKLNIGFQIGNNQPTTVSGPLEFTVLDIQVTGNNGLIFRDMFDCNSLKI